MSDSQLNTIIFFLLSPFEKDLGCDFSSFTFSKHKCDHFLLKECFGIEFVFSINGDIIQ